MAVDHTSRRANPFSTRFIRPGVVPYVFAPGETADGLARRLADLGGWAQIVGPHGSGKSTLVATLVDAMAEADRAARGFVLRNGQRRMPDAWPPRESAARVHTIIVDGYEQLGLASRWRLKARCRRQGWGLLVTAHDDVGFPTLLRLVPNAEMALAVVGRLLADDDEMIDNKDVAECFRASGGDLRETLFALYDRYERARTSLLSSVAAERPGDSAARNDSCVGA